MPLVVDVGHFVVVAQLLVLDFFDKVFDQGFLESVKVAAVFDDVDFLLLKSE